MPDVKRLNYFNGQFLREGDFSTEQTYHLEQQRDHARLMHTPGVAEGLEVPDPPAGASAVTVQVGVAYDDLGRRLRLSANQPVELAGFPADAAVYVTITYAEAPSDVSDETGTSGSTRVTEAPLVAAATTAPGNPNRTLVLARVVRTGTTVTSIDRTSRLRAGARGGDLAVNSLRLGSDTIDPSNWPTLQISLPDTAQVVGDLDVTGNIKTSGTVDGRDIAADGTANAAHRAATNNPHATTAAQVDAQGGTNRIVAQINAGTGVILEPRIDVGIARVSALNAHTGSANAHPASSISAVAHNNISAGNVQSQLSEIVTDLASQVGPGTGASLVGNDAIGAAPNNVAAGNLRTQLSSLLSMLAGHVTNATGAHAASAISVADAGGNLNALNVETALAEILDALEGDHFRGNEGAAGQHRTIRQPVLPSDGGLALVLDSAGTGSAFNHFRIYADSNYLWIVINALWNGAAWEKDSPSAHSGALRLSRFDFALLFQDTSVATFTAWTRTWRLPMSSNENGWELTGAFEEVGYIGQYLSNPETSSTRTVYGGQGVTYRGRFPSSASSITFANYNWTGNITLFPTLLGSYRDGFGFYIAASITAGATAYWYGMYTAVL